MRHYKHKEYSPVIIIVCGLNDRDNDFTQTIQHKFSAIRHHFSKSFPKAKVAWLEINASPDLTLAQISNISKINSLFKQYFSIISGISDAEFQTADDHIHWSDSTREKIFQTILSYSQDYLSKNV